MNKLFAISMLLLGNVIRQEELTPGDHVYTYRRYGLYTHRGIYVGEGSVIHFTRTGVNKTSIDSFRQEDKELHSLHLYAYGRPLLEYWLTRWGTCTALAGNASPEEVVNRARELYEGNGFGEYDLVNNNCEHFATFCRTSVRASAQTALVAVWEDKAKGVKERTTEFLQRINVKGPSLPHLTPYYQ
ncbi:hypothetical protein ACJRO7_032743 [Eucalyptus globulus]|uniref:LRAT domain-containing protein n=1 Tax=Eucalyptus globulus TaxID=34317 RepID=A0ABD3JIX5_EUCGL